MSGKHELLEELDPLFSPQKRLDFNYFLYVLLILSFICLLLFPKLYIQQQIYFKSRDISKLKSEYDMLKEENKIISASVESIRFKNQILDTLFLLKK
jgi:uncharacterized membrane protein YcgQ (UPF0703/DUF1980 family)